MPSAFPALPGSMIVASAQSPITLYGAPTAAASRLSPARGGARGAGRSHAVPNMATDTSVKAAISESVLGECMEHLQYEGALEHGPPSGGVPVTPITGPLRRMHRHKRQGIEASTRSGSGRTGAQRILRARAKRRLNLPIVPSPSAYLRWVA